VVKKPMTLNLTNAEMQALESLSAEKQMTKTAVLRQALRLYQLINSRLVIGEKVVFEDVTGKEKKELIVL
jgi:hypothetical protein